MVLLVKQTMEMVMGFMDEIMAQQDLVLERMAWDSMVSMVKPQML